MRLYRPDLHKWRLPVPFIYIIILTKGSNTLVFRHLYCHIVYAYLFVYIFNQQYLDLNIYLFKSQFQHIYKSKSKDKFKVPHVPIVL